MDLKEFKLKLKELQLRKENLFSQFIEDIKYINGEDFKVSDIIDVEILEPSSKVYICYISKDDEIDGYIPIHSTDIPISYFEDRDKFMHDLKDRKARTKRQNLEMMISMAEDQLKQYKKQLEELEDGK